MSASSAAGSRRRREQEPQRERGYGVLLRLIAAHLRNPGAWSSHQELGIARTPEAPSRIRKELEGAVPERFDPIVSDRGGSCRLNPEVLVERVPCDALAAHPGPTVQRIAKEQAAHAGAKTWRPELASSSQGGASSRRLAADFSSPSATASPTSRFPRRICRLRRRIWRPARETSRPRRGIWRPAREASRPRRRIWRQGRATRRPAQET